MDNFERIWSNMWPEKTATFKNSPLKILNDQLGAINRDQYRTGVNATIISTPGAEPNTQRHVLYIRPRYAPAYNYYYIEFDQPIQAPYPVRIRAFNADEDLGYVQDDSQIYEKLRQIINDNRSPYLFSTLKNLGSKMAFQRKKSRMKKGK